MDEITETLQTELDSTVKDVMTERRKHPELTDEQYMDSLPMFPEYARNTL